MTVKEYLILEHKINKGNTKVPQVKEKSVTVTGSGKNSKIHPMQIVKGQIPSKSNGYRIAKGRLIKSDKVSVYESVFYHEVRHLRNLCISGKFEFNAKVFFKTEKSDIDGCLKVVLDCLQTMNVIKNDNLCWKINIEKFVDKKCPRIEFELIEILDKNID